MFIVVHRPANQNLVFFFEPFNIQFSSSTVVQIEELSFLGGIFQQSWQLIDLLFAFLHLETKIASSFPICVIGRERSDAAWKWSDSASSAYMTGATKAMKKNDDRTS